jgi:hypothetical protein
MPFEGDQKITDKYEPLKSSIYAPGSELEKITRRKNFWSAIGASMKTPTAGWR